MVERMRWRKLLEPRMDAPFPLWMIFPVIFVVLYASHFMLLGLPYYWDEAGYYIPAAWDFFRTGSLIPLSTLSNAHPPLPSVYLALWWEFSGFSPEVTREAVLIVASLALLAVWRLALKLTGSPIVALWTVVLTALYPIWFAQSSLAHADIFAAACTLWGLVYALPDEDRSPRAAALWFTAAALCKETAVVVPLALAVLRLAEAWKAPAPRAAHRFRESAWLAVTCVPLAGWYAWHYARTGFLFGNPEFLRYNAQATLAPLRILAAFGHRVLHLTAHMNMFVPVLIALASLLLPVRQRAGSISIPGIRPGALRSIFYLLFVNALLFSVIGGALLTRYLLPMYPLVLLLAVSTIYRRAPSWQAFAVLAGVAFIVGLFVNPPYGFAPEDNLEYARITRMELAGIAQLRARYPGATVLSAWPMTDELTRPELGYVKTPYTGGLYGGADCTRCGRAGEILGRAGVFHQVRSALPTLQPGRREQGARRALLWTTPRPYSGGDCRPTGRQSGVGEQGPGDVGCVDPVQPAD
jgi:4-amino-4-deoxy-L-arabinose transferase-like glycosyltransferase